MMNLPFQLRNDKGLREDSSLQPFDLVSLYMLIDLYAPVLIDICLELAKVSQTGAISQDSRYCFEALPDFLKKHDLSISASKAARLLAYINKQPLNEDGLKAHCDNVYETIIDELHTRLVLIVPNDCAKYYKSKQALVHKKISKRFPQLKEDVGEAANCFALGRNSACAFHLVRIMEYLVHQLARRLRVEVNPEMDTW